MRNSAAAMNVALRSADSGDIRSSTFIRAIPTRDARSPSMTVSRGSAMASGRFAANSALDAPMAMVAMMLPT